MSQKVLIIDDDEDLAELLGLLMRKNGYEAEVAYGGKEALKLARSFNPSVIIQDYMLPDMKGLDLLKALRSELPESYVVIITARGNEDIAVDLLKAGACDYIKKPFETEKLLHTVEKTLQLRYAELNRDKLTEELVQQNRELLGLNAISAALTSEMSCEQKCDTSLSIVMNTMMADIVNVFTIEPGNKLHLKNTLAKDGKDIEDCSLDRLTGLASYVADKKKPAVVADFSAEKRFKVPKEVREHGIVSALAVPMMFKDAMKGVLAIYSKTQRSYPSFDIKLVTSFANLFAMSLENESMRVMAQSAKNLWQASADMVDEKFMVLDPNYHILYANKAVADFTGHSTKELVGQTCCWMMHGSKEPSRSCPVAEVLKTGEPASKESNTYGKKGERYMVSAQPVLDADGKLVMVVEHSKKLEG